MPTTVNAGARLDRLPISSFHYRIFWLIGAGMFFDGYDLYVAGGVLAGVIQTKFSTLPQNLQFLFSLTFVGMDHRLAGHGFPRGSLRPPFHLPGQSPDLWIGLVRRRAGAGHDPTDRLPLRAGAWARRRDRGRLFDPHRVRAAEDARTLARLHGVPHGLRLPGDVDPVLSHHPDLGLAADVRDRLCSGSLIVWYLRKKLPESPRWLEAQGRTAEAEALMAEIEKEAASGGSLPPPAAHAPVPQVPFGALLRHPLIERMVVGCWVLITINSLIFGFS